MGEGESDVNTLSDIDPSAEHHKPSEKGLSSNQNGQNGPNGADSTSMDGAAKEEQNLDNVFQIHITLPHHPYATQVMVSTQEQVQDLRQSVIDLPGTFQYTCFHLEYDGARVNDFAELSEIKGLAAGSTMKLLEDPYTEKEARMHMIRIREIIGAAGDRFDMVHGISAGLSLHDTISPWNDSENSAVSHENGDSKLSGNLNPLAGYQFDAPASIRTLLPPIQEPLPKTVKSVGASTWNPPPPYLRQKGHLLYLQLTTNEGEQYQITSHVSGFFVNKSSNNKFDPYPRVAPKNAAAHSLFTLIGILSPSFNSSFGALLDANNKRDPLANYQLTSAIPSSPWLVDASALSLSAHQPDLTRSQETYLMSGIDNTETLRDWNEEIQSTRELPKESVQERVFRERLMSKISAEFNEAAARGAVMVARGEVAPLNPTESTDARIFVYNNIFYSFGADGVGTFTSEGGDEAARVAVGKDVSGVKAVNQLDISGLSTPGTMIVDYLGKRLVAQSIVPGIFKPREPEEHQVDYGGVEGREVVAHNDTFVAVFSKVSTALKVKKHPVWDKEGTKHVLEGSVETKGLLGTDGRKYILDLYRLTPLDIQWLEEYWSDIGQAEKPKDRNYPHRMTVLRPELVETYWRLKMGEYVKENIERQKAPPENGDDSKMHKPTTSTAEDESEHEQVHGASAKTPGEDDSSVEQEGIDTTKFSLAFNPDVFCGQTPRTDEEKEELANDESNVRALCGFLHEKAIPEIMQDLKEGEVGFPMDGQSLSRLMHKRGINIRYLGKFASLADEQGSRLRALKALATQEMIARAFKHLTNRYLKDLPAPFGQSCLAHLLNCLLGAGLNSRPEAQLDEDVQYLYKDSNYSFAQATAANMKADIEKEVQLRYRFVLEEDWISNIKHVQLLREISLKLGLQLVAKDYQFVPATEVAKEESGPVVNGDSTHPLVNGHTSGHTSGTNGKKKRKNGDNSPPVSTNGSQPMKRPETFAPDDIANLVPVIKDACAKSSLAEEALEAGRISIMQNNRELGQELLLESLSLHEQIYGVLHPEVARVYHQLAMLYYQLDEKAAAVELAHKAVVISERTLGIDSTETILSYLNLGLFEHGNGNTIVALSCMRHALELWKLIYGLRHPDSITTINNAAVMLQSLKFYHESRLWFETSLAICEELSGRISVNTATLSFQLAQALALDHDPKGAVQRMRDAYGIFRTKLGPEDRNTKEADTWLEQLTQNAVSIARHAKDLQARRLRKVLLSPKVTLGTRPQPQVGQSPADLMNGRDSRSTIAFDPRSIDELMKYIEGGAETLKKPASKKRTTPRRRA